MKRIVVVGIGNRIMGDDGIGVYVVEELVRQRFLPYIEYIIGETDMDYWVTQAYDADLIIIVDAAITGKEPGAVAEILPEVYKFGSFSAHQFSISELKKTTKLLFIGIEPAAVDYWFALSEELGKLFEQIVEDVKRCITFITTNTQYISMNT